MACVNCSVFEVQNNIRNLVFHKCVSYSPKLISLWKHLFLCIILHKHQLTLMRLIHAMRSNGPLPQVAALVDLSGQIWGGQKFIWPLCTQGSAKHCSTSCWGCSVFQLTCGVWMDWWIIEQVGVIDAEQLWTLTRTVYIISNWLLYCMQLCLSTWNIYSPHEFAPPHPCLQVSSNIVPTYFV